jgi:uncharacterized integral membrane protein
MQQTKLIIGIVLLLLLAIFTVQNASVVTINFFFWEYTVSRGLMIFFVLAIGVIIGLILGAYIQTHKHTKQSKI